MKEGEKPGKFLLPHGIILLEFGPYRIFMEGNPEGIQNQRPLGIMELSAYYGVQATKTFAKEKVVIQDAVAKVEGVVKGVVKISERLTYRQRYEQSTGRDPFRCPHCQREMEVWRIWHPTYGVIYDEG